MSGNAFLNRQIPPTFDGRPTKTIAFAAELVRAILAGRKTQTRRLVRPLSSTKPAVDRCPIAAVGDYLAVREAWAKTGDRYVYAADAQVGVTKFRPAMYMPRDASRIKLAVLAANAERLTAITRDAALAEGCPIDQVDPVQWFTGLWDGIFKAAGERFADDPWVWVITFTVAEIKA